MPTYIVVWECEFDTETPREAAEGAQQMLDNGEGAKWEYTVRNYDTGNEEHIDLSEDAPEIEEKPVIKKRKIKEI